MPAPPFHSTHPQCSMVMDKKSNSKACGSKTNPASFNGHPYWAGAAYQTSNPLYPVHDQPDPFVMWQTNKQTNKTISGDNIPYQWLSINCKESGYSPRFPLLHQQPYLFAFHLPFWPTCSLESVSCCLGHLAAIGCCNSTCFWLDAHNTRTYSMYVHGTINGTWYTYAYIHSGF